MEQQPGLWDQGKGESELQTIPFVIDNQRHCVSDVLNTLMARYRGQSMDIATAYFNIKGWQLVAENISAMGSVRLLLGNEPEEGSDIGMRKVGVKPVKGLIENPSDATFGEKTLRLVEDLTAFLREERVQVRLYTKGFLHANCYIFYTGGNALLFFPTTAIVGSSNFTRPGLLTNKELNLVHRANLTIDDISPERLRGLLEKPARIRLNQLDPQDRLIAASLSGVLAINELAEWYDQQWEQARDFKEELIDLLDASKFGHITNTSAKTGGRRGRSPGVEPFGGGTERISGGCC